MTPEFNYQDLLKKTKKQLIQLAGFRNAKHLYRSGIFFTKEQHTSPFGIYEVKIPYMPSRKQIARALTTL